MSKFESRISKKAFASISRTPSEKIVWITLSFLMLGVALVFTGFGIAHMVWYRSITFFGIKWLILACLPAAMAVYGITVLIRSRQSPDNNLQNGVKK